MRSSMAAVTDLEECEDNVQTSDKEQNNELLTSLPRRTETRQNVARSKYFYISIGLVIMLILLITAVVIMKANIKSDNKSPITQPTKYTQTNQHVDSQSFEELTRSNKNDIIVTRGHNVISNQNINVENIPKPDTLWKQRAITIVGGNGIGDHLDQTHFPVGITIDDNQTIYIADYWNHRIIEWKPNATHVRIVAGGNGNGNQINQLNYPTDVIIDQETNFLIICDQRNRRVIRWSRENNANRQVIIEDTGCFGLAMDEEGSLYVSDSEKGEVRRWKRGEKNGIIVAGGNGRGDHLNQLEYPTFIFVDNDYSLYVSDEHNHRVMKWTKDAKQGIVVAGGNNRGKHLAQLSSPHGIIVGQFAEIYVADYDNHRVMCWRNGAKEGSVVVGGDQQPSNQLNAPVDLLFDRQRNLYVVDHWNHRLQKFEIEKQTKSQNKKWKPNGVTVAGGNGGGNQSNQLYYPCGFFIDEFKTIYITDYWNNRIVKWKHYSKNGEVIAGKNGIGNRNDQLNSPRDIVIDNEKNSFIICDRENRRVVRWFFQSKIHQQVLIGDINCWGLTIDKNGFIYVSDWQKNEVKRWKLGDTEGTIVAGGNGNGSHLNQLNYPTYIFVDKDYSVYISDSNNHRVMKWRKDSKEGVIVAGGNAEGNAGNQLTNPRGVSVDELGQIYVADLHNHRVMLWHEGHTEGSIVVGGYGQGKQSYQLHHPTALSFDVEGNLYVADWHNHRIQKFERDFN